MFYCFIFSSYVRFFLQIYIETNVNISNKINFSGPGCSKLMMSLVNVSLKFQTLISQMIFFVEKMCEAFALQKLLSFFQQKISVYLVIKW